MKKQKQQGIKKRLTKGFVKAAVIGAIAAMIGVVALLIAASQYEKALNRYGFTQGDIGKAMTAFSESRSALRAVVGYDEEAVIKSRQSYTLRKRKRSIHTWRSLTERSGLMKAERHMTKCSEHWMVIGNWMSRFCNWLYQMMQMVI